MGLFTRKQESKEQRDDMKCWNCDKLISHKKVKWDPRQVGDPDGNVVITEQLREFEKSIGNKEAIATPNQIFGLQEYEYRGKCPECHAELTCFWRGKDSFNKIQGVLFSPKPKPFSCNECEHIIDRGFQIWYSIRMQNEDKIKEYLVTICPKCNAEQGYPFEYNLDSGIIE